MINSRVTHNGATEGVGERHLAASRMTGFRPGLPMSVRVEGSLDLISYALDVQAIDLRSKLLTLRSIPVTEVAWQAIALLRTRIPEQQGLDGALKSFKEHLRDEVAAGRISSDTRRAYGADAEQLAVWLAGLGQALTALTQDQAAEYVQHLAAQFRPKTVRRKIMSLRVLYRYLRDTDQIVQNPMCEVAPPATASEADLSAPFLAAPMLRQLLAAPAQDKKGFRDRAVLLLMAVQGLSVSEVCSLSVEDLSLDCDGIPTLRVLRPNDAQRQVPLTDETYAALRRWLRFREVLHPETSALFVSLHWTSGRSEPGQPISPRGVRAMVDEYLSRIGAKERGVSCQSLRRAYAALSLAQGADLHAVSRSLGHKSMAATRAYVSDAARAKANPGEYLRGLI